MKLKLLVIFASILVLSESASEPKFAPYIDVTRKDEFKLVDLSHKTGVKAFTLAFALGGHAGCDPTWAGEFPITEPFIIDQIKEFKKIGGDVIVATGGAMGPYLEASCSSPGALATAYKKILDATGSTHLDIDIEASIAVDNMNAALAQVQKERPQTTVSFTLMVQGDDYGITDALGVDLLKNAVKHGVRVDIVNPMTMEFGASKGGSWGDAVIRAAESTINQMKKIWPQKSSAELHKMLGVTPMIGRNFNGKIFEPAHAHQLVQWANSNRIGHLAFWSIGRDNGKCAAGGISPACSSIKQGDYEFTKAFNGFTGTSTGPDPTDPPVTDNPVTDKGTTQHHQNHTSPTTQHHQNHTSATTQPASHTTHKPGKVDCSIDGGQYPHETNCNQYWWCYGGVAHLNTCPSGTVFDIKITRCNFPKDAQRTDCH